MTVTITQTCDRCGDQRDLNVGYHGGRSTIEHLCSACINTVLTKETQES